MVPQYCLTHTRARTSVSDRYGGEILVYIYNWNTGQLSSHSFRHHFMRDTSQGTVLCGLVRPRRPQIPNPNSLNSVITYVKRPHELTRPRRNATTVREARDPQQLTSNLNLIMFYQIAIRSIEFVNEKKKTGERRKNGGNKINKIMSHLVFPTNDRGYPNPWTAGNKRHVSGKFHCYKCKICRLDIRCLLSLSHSLGFFVSSENKRMPSFLNLQLFVCERKPPTICMKTRNFTFFLWIVSDIIYGG